MYIEPITRVHSTFAEAKDFHAKTDNASLFFRDEKKLSIIDLVQGRRNLIVGEPGVGKSLLLEKIKEHLATQGITTTLIGLRQTDAIQRIDEFLRAPAQTPRALLLDALDEVRSNVFPEVLQKIEEISRQQPTLPLYLSARWVFITRYATSFPTYRFITISPFTEEQVREYLLAEKHSETDVTALLRRVLSFNHNLLVIQIPRYLCYLNEYLKKHPIGSINELSRNNLFEHFINAKLDLEDKKLNADKSAITKRMLEKLALAMEIYQNNMISKDELMTFFDDLKSDLKFATMSALEAFFDNSLLKVSDQDIDKVAFDNTEFQEYLAAKEITRFSDPRRAAFSFAVDPTIKTIYPTWFNALTFLIDMQPDLLEQLVEFAGLRGGEFKIVDEQFLTFLNKLNPKNVPLPLRRTLFKDLLAYHNKRLQWMPLEAVSAVAGFFDTSLESILKSGVEQAERELETKHFVPLGNIDFVVGYLFRIRAAVDRSYWRGKLVTHTADKNDNGVLQRHALWALEQLGDPSVVDELPTKLLNSQELVGRALLSLCTEIAPDNLKSVDYFIEGVKRNDLDGRYGLLAMKEKGAIKKFLTIFRTDDSFCRRFLEQTSLSKDREHLLVEHIAGIFDDEIRELCNEVILKSLDEHVVFRAEKSVFVAGLWKLLKERDPAFIPTMIGRIRTGDAVKTRLLFAQGFFAEFMEKEDVPTFINTMKAANESDYAFSVMQRIKFSGKPSATEIFEEGRPHFFEEYREWEEAIIKSRAEVARDDGKELIAEFKTLLEPEPGKFSGNVFPYYNQNAKTLDPLLSEPDKDRLIDLITGTVLKLFDPGKQDLKITDDPAGARSITTSGGVHMFGDALLTARHLGIDVSPFRQHIINYIPFAWNEQLKAIFHFVPNITPDEIAPVIEVYKQRKSDLWRNQPISFIEAVEQYHITEALPVLKEFVKEQAHDQHTRVRALIVLETLAPDSAFLKEIFESYKDKSGSDKEVAEQANAFLITSYGDRDVIAWRIEEIVNQAKPHTRQRGAHWVGPFEEELKGKSFAKPLMQLNHSGYEPEYLRLLDEAMALWARGHEFYEYSEYLQSIVFAYFDNLKEKRSYEPLNTLEKKIEELQDHDGANWLAGRMVNLRRSYLAYLGKPANIAEAIQKYNEARTYENRKILNSGDLFRHLQNAIETELQRWIEGEGAYDFILTRVRYKPGRQAYEELIQKTLKSQILYILSKRSFQIDVSREAQLLDGKRIDFLIRYGFAGPIGIEIKLTSNSDMRGRNLQNSPSYKSMQRYMSGYAAPHGIFLIFDNTNARNLSRIKATFEGIQNVWVKSFSTGSAAISQKKSSKPKGRKAKRQASKSATTSSKRLAKRGPNRKESPR